MTATERTEMIEACVNAARRPCPRIVGCTIVRHMPTGRSFGGFGMIAAGMSRDDCKEITQYAYLIDGATVAPKPFHTVAEAQAYHDRYADKQDKDLREHYLTCTDAKLQESAEYWLKTA